MVTRHGLKYSLDELRDATGLSASFIYNLTTEKVIPGPSRGLVEGNPGKGLYDPEALSWLKKYSLYRSKGLASKEAKDKIKKERGVPVIDS